MLRHCSRRMSSRLLLPRLLTRFHQSSAASTALDTSSNTVNNNNQPPFDCILIANRGEIVQRVIRSCDSLGVDTVAVYSTADAQAPYVNMATNSVCIGAPPASESYLMTETILQAARDTGAQAIHPGFGFLSENATFAQDVIDANLVWLGPSPRAVELMGDKLTSKKLALEAGVNCIPGHGDPIQSLEQALSIINDASNDLHYPVLLKAAAGGGGKGMRTCYNDQELREAYGIAKAESLQFFKDDRLLLEQYVEEPHHIEFQVLCSENDFCIFPERECSIQRRNQKVIEESPSVFLQPSTRAAMAVQVEQLCRNVSYTSAGTVEFLVDKHQQFYFLEMNTRLQVEHPVSEAITGVDLVKGMLWVGAGWGVPEEFKRLKEIQLARGEPVLPHSGHAIEARIYAEDPLRGFLPSTGPLSMYSEPSTMRNTAESYVRVDTGVIAGQNISPFYDPMLSKVVYKAPTRKEAIAGLCQALDEYVIQGVQHNTKLVQSVLRHPVFQQGITPTSFLPTHYPDGFHGVELNKDEQLEYVAAVAVIEKMRRKMMQRPPLAGANDATTVIVKIGGLFGTPFRVELSESNAIVTPLSDEGQATSTTVRLDSRFPSYCETEKHLAHVSINGKNRTAQVLGEDATGEMYIQMFGADKNVLVQSVREHELSQHMHVPVALDTSDLIMSPMPGTLISYAVQAGDHVEAGQELCIVEAMKMQNIIRSPKTGKIALCKADVGSSLKRDEVILEFDKEVK
ncbi:hypothetical protein MPSEU_001038700 [Mayamaea pseudoterrestris]|nr:hypothetical protein MPSEU_001038700 [Mayamaea pseudoterrestris]